MEVLTTAPGLQLYPSNFFDGSLRGKAGAAYARYAGVCLETQGLPNAINQARLASTALPAPPLQPRHDRAPAARSRPSRRWCCAPARSTATPRATASSPKADSTLRRGQPLAGVQGLA